MPNIANKIITQLETKEMLISNLRCMNSLVNKYIRTLIAMSGK